MKADQPPIKAICASCRYLDELNSAPNDENYFRCAYDTHPIWLRWRESAALKPASTGRWLPKKMILERGDVLLNCETFEAGDNILGKQQ